jgi:hypothetical protein
VKARAIFLFAAVGCGPRPPELALDAYRDAVARKDAAAVLALSDATFRAAFDESAVEAELADRKDGIALVTSSDQRATFTLESGETIELVLEDGAWRVRAGGISPARFDTPERALETFFRGALAGKLDVVRQAIPKRFRDALTTDAALEQHIAAMADRIARARSRIGPIGAGRAAIHGARADLTYGPGLAVTFEKEDDRWVIVDLE